MPQKSMCSDHKAVNRVSTTQCHLQATGIRAVACAHHGCFFPQSVIDFQKGERSGSNSLRCLLLISIPDKSTLIMLFAKACIRWKAIFVRNFLFLTCPTHTRTLRLPQTTPQTTTTSHTNHTQGNYRLHHPDHRIPFPNHQSLRPTNPPSLQHQRTQPPIPKRIHPYLTGTHDPWHDDLGHLGHTGPGPFGTMVNHNPSIFNYNRIPGT